ncbi:uncharacterized protein LOC127290447 isoform X1 [Leptopilina boulardi]|uniref:uncharacterized protein LOC127290447 isoform X1 n=1 Tax=Leptopilina boulardi TaxID=63433 RepID=UPI0021F684DD|nr:uncharacterized protein LOC127290447 isoform X1 [Leptopilina boulardi]
MDTTFSSNPLAAVQLIPIFNYLTILSDFLFIENYLIEEDRYKQVPTVNGLYKYLEDHNGNETMIVKLIRNLLQGSDLYGEQDNEKFDVLFINTMFDYIISSLVFDKYGNIYGFLADTVRKTKNLQYYYYLQKVKENLKNATFENINGTKSSLTELAVNRIYTDIILPIFPEPKTNISILSLDYIFAQAGSTYLRLGRINKTCYYNFTTFYIKNFNFVNTDKNLFEEYLAVGCIIKSLLYHKQLDTLSWKYFAFSALFYYISNNDKVEHEKITNVTFNPLHWERAYHNLFEYVNNAFVKIGNKLTNDYIYKLHVVFSHFKSRAEVAKYFINEYCKQMTESAKEGFFHYYLASTEPIKCGHEYPPPVINDGFINIIHDFGEVYEKYDLGITQQVFNESLTGDLNNVIINLLIINDKVVDSNFKTSQHLPFDLLEFIYPNNRIPYYYALKRENYTATLIPQYYNKNYFRQLIGPNIDRFILSANRTIVKFPNENVNELRVRLMKYKKDRFMSYLNYSDNSPKQSQWWKEFGLSLVPFYPCFSNITGYHDVNEQVCEKKNIKFLNKFTNDISSHLIQPNTQNLLSSFGTNIKTIFLNETIQAYVDSFVNPYKKIITLFNDTALNTFYDELSLHIEKPQFEISSITKEEINYILTIIDYFEKNINQSFKFVNNMLTTIQLLKDKYIINVGDINNKSNISLFVNSWNGVTGYGYKFIHIKTSEKETVTAQLRTDYELKDKIFISPNQNSSKDQKVYTKWKNESLELKYDEIFITKFYKEVYLIKSKNGSYVPLNRTQGPIYEINNQLRRESINISFYGISSQDHNDDYCNSDEYLQEKKNSMFCSRHRRYIKWTDNVSTIIKNLLKNNNDNSLDRQMRNISRKYYFRNLSTLKLFLSYWLEDRNYEKTVSSIKTLDKSGLLNELLYATSLDNRDISIEEGENRINSNYTYRERRKIEEEMSLKNIINNFNNQRAAYLVTLEDYYAIRNFATTGHERITGDTNEAKLMKLALYKLAIRQSDDSNDEFDKLLFYFQSIPEYTFRNEVYKGKSLTLQTFILTSTKNTSALRFSARSASGYKNILYEINFNNSYERATIKVDVHDTQVIRERKVILLPGSEFKIEKIAICPNEKIGSYYVVKLIFTSNNTQNYENILRQITQIRL